MAGNAQQMLDKLSACRARIMNAILINDNKWN